MPAAAAGDDRDPAHRARSGGATGARPAERSRRRDRRQRRRAARGPRRPRRRWGRRGPRSARPRGRRRLRSAPDQLGQRRRRCRRARPDPSRTDGLRRGPASARSRCGRRGRRRPGGRPGEDVASLVAQPRDRGGERRGVAAVGVDEEEAVEGLGGRAAELDQDQLGRRGTDRERPGEVLVLAARAVGERAGRRRRPALRAAAASASATAISCRCRAAGAARAARSPPAAPAASAGPPARAPRPRASVAAVERRRVHRRVNPGGIRTSSGVRSSIDSRPSPSRVSSIPARRISSTLATPASPFAARPQR